MGTRYTFWTPLPISLHHGTVIPQFLSVCKELFLLTSISRTSYQFKLFWKVIFVQHIHFSDLKKKTEQTHFTLLLMRQMQVFVLIHDVTTQSRPLQLLTGHNHCSYTQHEKNMLGCVCVLQIIFPHSPLKGCSLSSCCLLLASLYSHNCWAEREKKKKKNHHCF